MFKFFRKNVVIIGWSIVIFFAATMFTGGLFFGFNFSDSENNLDQQTENNFASLGKYPLNVEYFSQFFNSYITAIYNQTDKISPIQLETILLESFNKVVEHDVFFIAANADNIELTSIEKKSMEKEFLLENNIKSKSELKKLLKENNRSYKNFEISLNRELVVRKFKNLQLSNVTIDDYDVNNSFKSFKYDVLLFSNSDLNNDDLKSISEKALLDLENIKFNVVETKYEKLVSMNVINGNDFVDYFQLDAEIRSFTKDISFNTFLVPQCNDSYCFSVKFIEEKINERPKDFKIEEYSKQLQEFLQNEKLNLLISNVIEKNPLTIYSPDIKAIYYKSIGDFPTSLAAYQELSSNVPENPSPHFFRAQIFKQLQNNDLALSELQKADLKSKLTPDQDFPELHIFYGDELLSSDKSKSLTQYKKALELSSNNLNYLKLLKERFVEHKFNSSLKEVDEMIAMLEIKLKEKQDSLENQLIASPNNQSAKLD